MREHSILDLGFSPAMAVGGAAAAPTYRFHGRRRPARHSVLEPQAAAPENVGSTSTAVLRLYDPIDSWGGDWGVSAREFHDALDALPTGTQEIRLHLNSPGGEVFEAVAILNALRRHPANVVAVVDGIAASAASFIAAGADETIMAPNSQLMIHDAWGLCIGNAADMRDTAALLDQLSDNIASIYADKAGSSTETWRTAMLAESWYTAQAAVEVGLADSVEGSVAAASNSFDLSVFDRAGKAPVPTLDAPAADPAAELNALTEEQAARARAQERRHRLNTRKTA